MDYRTFVWLKKHVKIRTNSWVPKILNAAGVSPSRTIFFRYPPNQIRLDLFVHELWHVYQRERYKEKLWRGFKWMGTVYFHIRHRLEFIFYFIKHRSIWKAHGNISYEKEAYKYQRKHTNGEWQFYVDSLNLHR